MTDVAERTRRGRVSAFPVLACLWIGTVVWQAVELALRHTDDSADLGPAFLPLALGVVVLVLLVADLVRQVRTERAEPAEPSDALGTGRRLRRWFEPPPRRFVALAVVAAALGPWIGLAAAMVVLILGCLRYVEQRTWSRAVLTTVVLVAALYVVFVVLLQVRIELLPAY
ncbi:hypothetical protein DI005_28695 [Prauserella sp. PE36]|uniref:tripartite tricarboxylate transporter TctB family protein n=1 Tax=Prauserella sp. PE36 TaxID=1504709 RepID=UPI000DD4A52B|nr:tripartite tricarboxylate transporter TctB family protein [Prauserella sp. PE36]RBM14667.1 hypothetical protein DI005_28695 [Prauserella sp. PE36]